MLELDRGHIEVSLPHKKARPVLLEGFSYYRKRVEEGLVLPDWTARVKDNIATEITTHILDLRQDSLVGEPFPLIGLIHGWDEPLTDLGVDGRNGEVIANASIEDDIPEGIIRFSPEYLKELSSYRLGLAKSSALVPIGLGYLTAHELKHLHQARTLPLRFERDTTIFQQKGINAWVETETEKEAIAFGHQQYNSFHI